MVRPTSIEHWFCLTRPSQMRPLRPVEEYIYIYLVERNPHQRVYTGMFPHLTQGPKEAPSFGQKSSFLACRCRGAESSWSRSWRRSPVSRPGGAYVAKAVRRRLLASASPGGRQMIQCSKSSESEAVGRVVKQGPAILGVER